MMPTMAYNVLQSISILTNMLRVFTEKCVKGLTANEKRNAFYAQSTVSLATALNPYIGYAKAAEIVKESVATGRSIIDIARDKKLLSEQEIAEILDPVSMTEPQYPKDAAKRRDDITGKKDSFLLKSRAQRGNPTTTNLRRIVIGDHWTETYPA